MGRRSRGAGSSHTGSFRVIETKRGASEQFRKRPSVLKKGCSGESIRLLPVTETTGGAGGHDGDEGPELCRAATRDPGGFGPARFLLSSSGAIAGSPLRSRAGAGCLRGHR